MTDQTLIAQAATYRMPLAAREQHTTEPIPGVVVYDTFRDQSYPTHRFGFVPSYSGVTAAPDELVIGVPSSGSPEWLDRVGGVVRHAVTAWRISPLPPSALDGASIERVLLIGTTADGRSARVTLGRRFADPVNPRLERGPFGNAYTVYEYAEIPEAERAPWHPSEVAIGDVCPAEVAS